MAKWKTGMTLSQRNAYNKYMRLYKLRRALMEGHIPQPRKDVTALMMREYERHGASLAISMPQAWMDSAIVRGIKEDQHVIRGRVRNLLPADYTEREHGLKKLKILTDGLLAGRITVNQLLAIE